MNPARRLSMIIAAAGLVLSAQAFAHPKVVSTSPVDRTTVANVGKVTLSFSEPLIAALSGLEVVMTGMPGTDNHSAMKVNGVRVSVAPDGKTLVASLARPLPAGSYEAVWHAVSTDTHRVTGKLTFTVK